MAKESPQTNFMQVKKVVVGIIIGVIIGLVLECVNTFWMSQRPWLSFLFDFPLGSFVAAAGLIGCFIGIGAAIRKYTCRLVSKSEHLPICAAEFIKLVVKKMRYRKKVCADVMAELAVHFEDELKDCTTDEEKEQKARQLIADFGDVKLLAVLLRRAKKRCRPLWRTAIARTFQTIGILILCFIVYTAWFLTGKPTISVDYLALLNQMNWPEIRDEDNAWPYYEKAISLFVEPNKCLEKMPAFQNYRQAAYRQFGELTNTEQLEIRKWVEQNNAAWQEFVAGSFKPYSYKKVEYSKKDDERLLWNIIVTHLKPLRDLSKAGIWRCRMEIERGQFRQAIADCLAIVRAGKHFQSNKISIVEQLAGSSMAGLGCTEIRHIAETQDLSAADLEQIRQQLLQIYPHGFPQMDIEGKRLMFLDIVQHLFTDGGLGGGHLVPEQCIAILHQLNNRHDKDAEKYMLIPYAIGGMLHARRNETTAMANKMYERLNEMAKISPYERYVNKIATSDKILAELPQYRYFLLHFFTPAVEKISEIAFQGKTLYEATLTVLVLLRYEKEKGRYPESLNDLEKEGYSKQLPMDPFSDKPLVYRKTDNNFILYSVGHNFKDDGGQVYRDDKGRVRQWADEADTVFWPVQKN